MSTETESNIAKKLEEVGLPHGGLSKKKDGHKRDIRFTAGIVIKQLALEESARTGSL